MTWYEDLYVYVDRKDMDAAGAWFAENVVMSMGNGKPVAGRTDVLDSLRHFQSMLSGLTHTFLTVAEEGDTTFLETRTKFELWTGDSVDISGVTILVRQNELITAQRIYADMAPLFAAIRRRND